MRQLPGRRDNSNKGLKARGGRPRPRALRGRAEEMHKLPEPPPPPPASISSWGTSSIFSEATPDTRRGVRSRRRAKRLQSGTHLKAIGRLVGEQEDQGDALKGKVDKKQEELTRMAEVEEADFLDPFGADRGAGQAALKLDNPNGLFQG